MSDDDSDSMSVVILFFINFIEALLSLRLNSVTVSLTNSLVAAF